MTPGSPQADEPIDPARLGQDQRRPAAPPPPPAAVENPLRTLAAVGVSIAVIVVFWTRFGGAAVLFLPVSALYIAHVHLGGGLNEPPRLAIARLRKMWAERS